MDDHEALREGLEHLLEARGVEVVGTAGNAAAADDVLERAQPDVAVIDIALPDGSGIELTRRLLARRPSLGVVLYTGSADAELLYGGLDSGARISPKRPKWRSICQAMRSEMRISAMPSSSPSCQSARLA